jgi:uridine phosphorylase
MVVLIIVIVIVVLLVLGLWAAYNGLVKKRNRTQEAWSEIDVELKRRHDLSRYVVSTVRGYAALEERLVPALRGLSEPVLAGASWTTDAPYRETQSAIASAEAAGIVCVEMEAAALYAYGAARQRDVVCFAHITNSMAVNGNDFEKGAANGALSALQIAEAAARSLLVA